MSEAEGAEMRSEGGAEMGEGEKELDGGSGKEGREILLLGGWETKNF